MHALLSHLSSSSFSNRTLFNQHVTIQLDWLEETYELTRNGFRKDTCTDTNSGIMTNFIENPMKQMSANRNTGVLHGGKEGGKKMKNAVENQKSGNGMIHSVNKEMNGNSNSVMLSGQWNQSGGGRMERGNGQRKSDHALPPVRLIMAKTGTVERLPVRQALAVNVETMLEDEFRAAEQAHEEIDRQNEIAMSGRKLNTVAKIAEKGNNRAGMRGKNGNRGSGDSEILLDVESDDGQFVRSVATSAKSSFDSVPAETPSSVSSNQKGHLVDRFSVESFATEQRVTRSKAKALNSFSESRSMSENFVVSENVKQNVSILVKRKSEECQEDLQVLVKKVKKGDKKQKKKNSDVSEIGTEEIDALSVDVASVSALASKGKKVHSEMDVTSDAESTQDEKLRAENFMKSLSASNSQASFLETGPLPRESDIFIPEKNSAFECPVLPVSTCAQEKPITRATRTKKGKVEELFALPERVTRSKAQIKAAPKRETEVAKKEAVVPAACSETIVEEIVVSPATIAVSDVSPLEEIFFDAASSRSQLDEAPMLRKNSLEKALIPPSLAAEVPLPVIVQPVKKVTMTGMKTASLVSQVTVQKPQFLFESLARNSSTTGMHNATRLQSLDNSMSGSAPDSLVDAEKAKNLPIASKLSNSLDEESDNTHSSNVRPAELQISHSNESLTNMFEAAVKSAQKEVAGKKSEGSDFSQSSAPKESHFFSHRSSMLPIPAVSLNVSNIVIAAKEISPIKETPQMIFTIKPVEEIFPTLQIDAEAETRDEEPMMTPSSTISQIVHQFEVNVSNESLPPLEKPQSKVVTGMAGPPKKVVKAKSPVAALKLAEQEKLKQLKKEEEKKERRLLFAKRAEESKLKIAKEKIDEKKKDQPPAIGTKKVVFTEIKKVVAVDPEPKKPVDVKKVVISETVEVAPEVNRVLLPITESVSNQSNILGSVLTGQPPDAIAKFANHVIKPYMQNISKSSPIIKAANNAAKPPLASFLTQKEDFTSIKIADYRSSDEESEDDGEKKKVPNWAKSPSLKQALQNQSSVNVDELFPPQHARTCNLDEIFVNFKKTKRFKNRTSSGNWLKDREE